jgi:DNA (cytosine-5)-methyltransferase 1
VPTPTASNTKSVHLRTGGRPPRSYLPTVTVCGNYNRKGASKNSGDGLATVLGGPLNPPWIEWLMGFPDSHTELKPLETPSSPPLPIPSPSGSPPS